MSPKRRLLYILHEFDHLGGAQGQTKLLAGGMNDAFDVAIAFIDKTEKKVVLRRLETGQESRWPAEPAIALPGFREPVTEKSLAELLAGFSPHIIHIQNYSLWPSSIIEMCTSDASAGGRVVISFHDHFAITPDYTMFGVHDPRETLSPAYAVARFGSDISAMLNDRQKRMGYVLSRVRRRVVVSPYLKRTMEQTFGLEFEVIEPGIEPFTPLPRSPAGALPRFGFLGSFLRAKGMVTLVEAFLKLRRKYPAVELNLCGAPVPDGPPPPGVRLGGAYTPADLPRAMSEFDVGVIPSIWPETYCLVLSEMWNAGRPAIVSDIGALRDRVSDGVSGRRFPPGDSDALAGAMAWFIENDSWRSWSLPTPRTADDLAADHLRLYQSLV